jgi:hypothetical protein
MSAETIQALAVALKCPASKIEALVEVAPGETYIPPAESQFLSGPQRTLVDSLIRALLDR